MRNLFDTMKDAKGYASQSNAQRKLEKFKGAIPEGTTVFTAQRPSDGKWLAVVIYRDNQVMNIPFLCHNGICVTN